MGLSDMAGDSEGYGKSEPLADQPGEVVMERSEVDSNPSPPKDSLRDKLRAHYAKGMNKRRVSKLTNPLTPEIINRVAVPFFLFTVSASYKIGFVDVMPLMYDGYDQVILLQRCFITLISVEMMINWLGIRYVDSTYPRYLRVYGPPAHERMAARSGHNSDSSSGQVLQSKNSNTETASLRLWSGSPTNQSQTAGFHETKSASVSSIKHDLVSNLPESSKTEHVNQTNSSNLSFEVDLANEEMDKRINQVNTKSIDDLLNPTNRNSSISSQNLHKEEFPSASSLFYTQNEAEQTTKGNAFHDDSSNKMASESTTGSLISPTPIVTTQGNVITKAYPYWSWVPCYPCGRARPPRCHHCPLCKACVLKRDHHCFFAGSCVGYRNHRFFCIFLIWAWSGCMYATLHGFPYIGYFLWSDMSYLDVFFPLAIARFMLGYTQFQAALSVTTLTFLVYFDVLAATFIYSHASLVSSGVTSFEKVYLKSSLEIRDTRTLAKKIRSVFGPHWPISFFLPIHFLTEPEEDPVTWPDIQVFKR